MQVDLIFLSVTIPDSNGTQHQHEEMSEGEWALLCVYSFLYASFQALTSMFKDLRELSLFKNGCNNTYKEQKQYARHRLWRHLHCQRRKPNDKWWGWLLRGIVIHIHMWSLASGNLVSGSLNVWEHNIPVVIIIATDRIGAGGRGLPSFHNVP